MLELVFKNGFVGLTVACATFAVTPALAQEPDQPPPAADQAPPPAESEQPATDSPPPEEAPADETAGEAPAEEAPAEEAPADETPADETPSDAPPERQRVGIRSVPPQFVPVAAEPVLSQPKRAEFGSPEPRKRSPQPSRPRLVAARPPADVTFRRAITPAPAAVDTTVAASASGPRRPSRARDTRSQPVAHAQPLPARIFPRPVRKIAEVVPGAIWAVLAGLALLAAALGVSSLVAAMRARRLRRQREELLQEVGLLQTALLPSVPTDGPVSVAYRPANGASAGGDFYDAFELPGERTGLIIGDVSGHGRDALGRTTFVRYTLRAYLEAGLEPREVVRVGSNALAEHLDGGFATVTVAVYDRATGRVTYASAGHPPPIVAGTPEPYQPVTACSAPPLGIGEFTGFRQSTFTLTAGAQACLYTDGVTEARVNGRLLGVARLERALAELPAGADAERLLDAVAEMADEVPDDMALCLVTAVDGAPANGQRIEELQVNEHEVGDALERFLRACGVALGEVPGLLREAGEAARREGSVTVRVRSGDFRPGVDIVAGNLVRLAERRAAVAGVRPPV